MRVKVFEKEDFHEKKFNQLFLLFYVDTYFFLFSSNLMTEKWGNINVLSGNSSYTDRLLYRMGIWVETAKGVTSSTKIDTCLIPILVSAVCFSINLTSFSIIPYSEYWSQKWAQSGNIHSMILDFHVGWQSSEIHFFGKWYRAQFWVWDENSKTKEDKFSPPLEYEPQSPGTESQCATKSYADPCYTIYINWSLICVTKSPIIAYSAKIFIDSREIFSLRHATKWFKIKRINRRFSCRLSCRS